MVTHKILLLPLLPLSAILTIKICLVHATSLLPELETTAPIELLLNLSRAIVKRYAEDKYKFEHIIVIRSVNAESHNFERIVQKELQVPLMLVNENVDMMNVRLAKYTGFYAVIIIFMTDLDDRIKHTADEVMTSRHSLPTLFFTHDIPQMTEVMNFFKWCWQKNMLYARLNYRNVYGMHESLSFTPFPEMQLINLTEKDAKFNENKAKNLQGYLFEVDIFSDLPIVYQLPGEKEVRGIMGEIFKIFIRRLNATYLIHSIPQTSKNMEMRERDILLKPSRKLMDFGLNAFTTVSNFGYDIETSYPITQTRVCVIVPVVREAPRRFYLVYVFGTHIWMALGILFIGCILLHSFLNVIARPYGRLEFGLAIIYAINTFLSQGLSAHGSSSMAYQVILVCIALLGLILTNCYTGTLTSELSATLPGKQVNTLEDFFASDLTILVQHYERYIYFESDLLPIKLLTRLETTHLARLLMHRTFLNTSHAYVATMEKWIVLNNMQRYLTRKRFRIAEELCTGMIPQSMALQYDSPFGATFKFFILFLHQFGFIYRWVEQEGLYYKEMHEYLRETDLEHIPLNLEYMRYAFYLYFACIVICVMAFAAERLTCRQFNTLMQ